MPDVCPGVPDTWTVEVSLSGYFLTNAGGTGSATTGISLDGATYLASSIINQNFDSTGQFRESYGRSELVELDAGTHTISQLGNESHPASVSAARNTLNAKSVAVSC